MQGVTFVKNRIIKGLLAALRPITQKKHPAEQHRQRILVVATTALGDTLWATPAIESLRKSFPDAFIGVLTSPVGMQIFQHNPDVNALYELKEPLFPKIYSLWKKLYALQFDTILLFHASQRLTLPLCATLGAKRIIGTAGINKGLDSLLTDSLPKIEEHEIVRRLKMVDLIGGKRHSETLSFFLQPREHLSKKPGRSILLHPGSKDRFKQWPWQHFATVGLALQKQLGAEIFITGTKEEEGLMRQVAGQIPGAKIAESQLPLRAFAVLMEQMDLIICNDTGPFHLACALNKPVIGIYAATNPVLCGPHLAKRAVAISRKASCTPCLKRRCREPFCQMQIGTCEVIDAALKMFAP